MYYEHFGLRKNPFSLSTVADSLYYARSHSEALAYLLYGVRQPNGITLLLGAPGTGKTTLIRSLVGLLRPTRFVVSVVFAPMMESSSDVLLQCLSGFKTKPQQRSPAELLAFLQGMAEEITANGKQALVIVDEAQRLPGGALDLLRLISSLEHEGQQTVRLLLAAQPEMTKTLAAENMVALRQRISMRCKLEGLRAEEVWQYLAARIGAAGGDGRMLFNSDAVEAIAQISAGVPRLVNVLADHSLIAAFGHGAEVVDAELVGVAARQMDIAGGDAPHFSWNEGAAGFTSEEWRLAVQRGQRSEVPDFLRRFTDSLASEQGIARPGKSVYSGHDAASEFLSWTTSIEH